MRLSSNLASLLGELPWVAARRTAAEGVRVVVEPVNPVENPGYAVPSTGAGFADLAPG